MLTKTLTHASGKRFAALLSIGAAVSLLGGIACTRTAGDALPSAQAAPIETGPTPKLPYEWKNVAVVAGGFVPGIITHPKERGLMYARTDIGGAYRWDNKAQQWIPLTDEFGQKNWNFTGIESIAVDPTDANRVYAAVGTYTNNWAGNGAILRSTDRGDTWKKTDLPFKNGGNEDGRSAGERLAVDPNQPSHLLFGTRHAGLWESNDSGATWKKSTTFPVSITPNSVGITFITFAKGPSQTVFAGVASKETGLYRSDDGGKSWKLVPKQPTGLLVSHGALSSDGNLYLTYADAPGPNGMSDGAIWKLDTRSGTWTDITPLKPNGGDDKFGYAGVSVDAAHPSTVMVTTMDRWAKHDTIFRTTDGGKSWKDLGPQSERDSSLSPYLNWGRPKADLGHWIGDIEIDPFNPDHVLYVTGATIWSSLDATAADKNQPTHWVVGAKGLEETSVLELVSPPSGAPLLSVMGDIDGFRHDDLTVSPQRGFHQPSHGTANGIDFAEKNPQIVARVYGGGNGGAYSTDNGATWTEFATKPGNRGSGTIAVSADGSTFVWTTQGLGAFYSKDKGATWHPCVGLPADRRVIADRVNASTFYAFDSGSVYVSTDSGATFAVKGSGLPGGKPSFKALPDRGGDLWLGAESSGLYHSTDGGSTFTRLETVEGVSQLGFGKGAPGRNYPGLFIVGTVDGTFGFFRSDDAAKTWVRINDDKHAFHWVATVTGDPRVYGRVYLGTNGRGIIWGDVKQ